MCRASATNPTLKMVNTIVAITNPPGAPSPLPKPTATGRLPVIAVIGAEKATTMNTTPTRPIAPRRRVGRGSPDAGVVALASGTELTAMAVHLSCWLA